MFISLALSIDSCGYINYTHTKNTRVIEKCLQTILQQQFRTVKGTPDKADTKSFVGSVVNYHLTTD
jgi:hypothetical protein